MPSSIFSSKRHIPNGKNTRKLLVGLLGGVLLVLLLENLFRLLGITPSVKETATLWAAQRELTSSTTEEQIILIGASRSQLGVDIGVHGAGHGAVKSVAHLIRPAPAGSAAENALDGARTTLRHSVQALQNGLEFLFDITKVRVFGSHLDDELDGRLDIGRPTGGLDEDRPVG